MSQRYTVTSALPYANGPVHIGHLAGVYIPADIYVRYLRMKGRDVLFIGGSDEHGVPITIRASKEGITPQEVVDKYHNIIKDSFEKFGISFDVYDRTSSTTHHQTASDFFEKLFNEGKFIEKSSEQFYDEKNQQFLADRYIKGTCPRCGHEDAYGDQCENCGSTLSPDELIKPKSALSGEIPVKKGTKHWYLPLNEYENWLKEWILEGHKSDWKVNVYGQCKSWLDQGLNARAVTRDLDWGVEVPIKGADGKVLYVWFDAPIGYISATKAWAEANGKDWEPYWKSHDTKLVHFIGKDNIVFHCIIFPVMLKAHGDYILPDNVPANEFLNLENEKISTSRNWAVWLHEYLEDFPDKQDSLRYALCAAAPETSDNNFTWKDFQSRHNNELADNLGNFIKRAVDLTHKYFDGIVPQKSTLFDYENILIAKIEEIPTKVAEALENFKFRDAIFLMMELAREGNKYLAETTPWKVIKTDPDRVQTIINLSLQVCANLAVIIEPILPFTAEKLRQILNLTRQNWDNAGNPDLLPESHQLNKSIVLFEKIEDKTIEAQIQKLQNTKKMNEASEQKKSTDSTPETEEKASITFDDFLKMDIRVATITGAERVPKSDKLLKLTVDLGNEERTVVSGIALSYAPEDIIGKQVSFLTNLKPRKIFGIMSQGMILMAGENPESLKFVSPAEPIEAGNPIS